MKKETVNVILDHRYRHKQPPFGSKVFPSDCLYINGGLAHFTCDYHLPFEYLLEKYYPEYAVSHRMSDGVSADTRGLYKLNFRYLLDFVAKKPSKILDSVPSNLRRGKTLFLLNDSHEYGFYAQHQKEVGRMLGALEKKGMSERTFVVSGNLANGGLSVPTKNGCLFFGKGETGNRFHNFWAFRYFEEVVAMQRKMFYPHYRFSERLQHLRDNETKTFLSLNRIVKPFRVTLACLFWKNGLEDRVFLSHSELSPKQEKAVLTSEFSSFFGADAPDFFARLPFVVDTPNFAVNHWGNMPFEYINRSFVWVVTETLFDRDADPAAGFFTEKTYKPVSVFMPFVMLGHPFALKRLRNEGYRTFSEWWDESYDEETDPLKRMEKIETLLLALAQKSKAEWLLITEAMQPVLEHNFEVLVNTRQAKPYVDAVLRKYFE